jgi:hypothetical protein
MFVKNKYSGHLATERRQHSTGAHPHKDTQPGMFPMQPFHPSTSICPRPLDALPISLSPSSNIFSHLPYDPLPRSSPPSSSILPLPFDTFPIFHLPPAYFLSSSRPLPHSLPPSSSIFLFLMTLSPHSKSFPMHGPAIPPAVFTLFPKILSPLQNLTSAVFTCMALPYL